MERGREAVNVDLSPELGVGSDAPPPDGDAVRLRRVAVGHRGTQFGGALDLKRQASHHVDKFLRRDAYAVIGREWRVLPPGGYEFARFGIVADEHLGHKYRT